MTNVAAGEPPIGWLVPYVKPQKSTAAKTRKTAEEDEESEWNLYAYFHQ